MASKDEIKPEISNQTIRFSSTAYNGLREVILVGPNMNFFATSIVPFNTWSTPYNFLYFCLIVNKCERCTRLFINKKSKDDILVDPNERIHASHIVLAHEIFNYQSILLTYDVIINKILKSEECKEHLSTDEISTFTKDLQSLDFAFVNYPKDEQILVKPDLKKAEEEGRLNIEVIVNSDKARRVLQDRANDSKHSQNLKITKNPKDFSKYLELSMLLLKYIRDGKEGADKLKSDDFLEYY